MLEVHEKCEKKKLLDYLRPCFFPRLLRHKKTILRMNFTDFIVLIGVTFIYSVSRSIRCKEFQTLVRSDKQKPIQARPPREAVPTPVFVNQQCHYFTTQRNRDSMTENI